MNLSENLNRYAGQFSLIKTQDNNYTIKYNGCYLHSSKFPVLEAQRFIEPLKHCDQSTTIIILWGVGLGYHVELLVQQGFTVIAVELRREIAEIFKTVFPIERLHAFIDNDDPQKIFDAIVSLPAYQSLNFVELSMRNITFKDQMWTLYEEKGKHALRSTHNIHFHLMESWYCNILQNIQLLDSRNISIIPTTVFCEKKVIICSAGPSLKESLPYLEKIQHSYVIIAVDTALNSLLEYGIIPDFVHAVDAKIHNVTDFVSIEHSIFNKMILIADISVHPIIVSQPWKTIAFVSTGQPVNHPKKGLYIHRIELLNFLMSYGIKFPELQTGGSVATSAFHYALSHGAEKIIMIGQDLAYTNYRGHAVGTTYDRQYRSNTNRLKTLETIHAHKLPDFYAQGIDGQLVLVDPLLEQFRHWFEMSVVFCKEENLHNKVINGSENGAFFNSWSHEKLSIIENNNNNISINKTFDFFLNPKINLTILFEKLYIEWADFLLDSHQKNLLHEYFYSECTQLLKGDSHNEFLYSRKYKRLKKIITQYYFQGT